MESGSTTLVQHSLAGQHFGFSAADLGDLGASEYTLVTVVVDESGSTAGFKAEMEACIQEVVKSCKFSPRSDYLMIRLVAFESSMREIHGFKQLTDCDVASYDGCLSPGGATLLFETTANAIDATNAYGKDLADNEYEVNAIVIVITDGMDNQSSIDAAKVGESLQAVMRDEHLESIMSILVGVGVGSYHDVSAYLDEFKDKAGMTQYVELKDANAKTLAKLAAFISQSISSQSKSLNSGGMGQSQTLQF